ncbi:MAG: hypothetical protein IJT88_09790 [Kiritimatiellae bacterium]|nr:hypothetical protein [Kiritimatiellia bacterium]
MNDKEWKELVARCEKMGKEEEERVKARWLALSPPEIWQMTPEEVAKTGVMLNRNDDIRMFTPKLKFPSLEESRERLWLETA